MSASNGTQNGASKPLLFFTAMPGEGHTYPLLNVASSMIKRGYEVVFHGGPQFEDDAVAMGAEFSAGPSLMDPIKDPEATMAKGHTITDRRLPVLVFGLSAFFFPTMAVRTQAFEDALVKVREAHPDRQIIVFHELCSMNVTPFAYGRPLPRGFTSFPKTIGIAATNIAYPSVDAAPFPMGLPYDPSPACILRNKELHKLAEQGPMLPLFESAKQAMKDSGCTTIPEENPMAVWYTAPDVVYQMVSASMEYPMSDLPSKLQFAGCVPKKVSNSTFEAPSWWNDVIESSEKDDKKIVFVSQGTAELDYSQLLIPTMEAFRGRENVLVVAALGKRDAKLPEDFNVPENARWADYLSYDRILPYADVFVCNAGYGSTTHAVTNGTPMVLAGDILDKKEVTMRATYAGYACDLESSTPSVEHLRATIETVLKDTKFKNRAMELKAENEALDCMGTIEKKIIEFTR